MSVRTWQVVIADLRGSRGIAAGQRARVDRALRAASRALVRRYSEHVRSGPQILKGDELQVVLRADAPALTILTYLRARFAVEVAAGFDIRAGLGAGAIDRLSSSGPFASDGEAFHRARAAVEATRSLGASRRTAWRSGRADFDEVSEVLLALLDAVWVRWTPPQWEAVAGRLEDLGLKDIARKSGIRFQNVSKRLLAASWNESHDAIRWLERSATAAPAAPAARTVHPPKGESTISPRRG